MDRPAVPGLAEQLDADLGDPRLVPGAVAYRRLARGYWQAAPAAAPAGGVAALVTLSWGPPPTGAAGMAWGLDGTGGAPPGGPRWYGRTDRRGQFRARGLPAGECFVRYVPGVRAAPDVWILEAVGDDAARQALLAAAREAPDADLRTQAGQAAERLEPRPLLPGLAAQPDLQFACAGRRVTVRRRDRERGALLEVELTGALAAVPLLRVRVLGDARDVLAEGFVGLTRDPQGSRGRANLDALADGWRDHPDPLFLWFNQQAAESLDWRDYQALERSWDAAAPECRPALEGALRRLRATFADVLPAAVFGVPAPDRVVAVLPAADAALEAALGEALHAARGELGGGAGNRGLVERAKELLVGRAALGPADQLHILEIAGRLLQKVSPNPGSGEVSTAYAAIKTDPTGPFRFGSWLDARDSLQGRVYRLMGLVGCPAEEVAQLLGIKPERAGNEFRRALSALPEWQQQQQDQPASPSA
jgi:hypothetical protein